MHRTASAVAVAFALVLASCTGDPNRREPGDTGADADAVGQGVVYVDETAAPGGDGTAVAPFRTLAEAFGSAAAESLEVAVAGGEYEVSNAVPAVEVLVVRGAGPGSTVISGDIDWQASAELGLDGVTVEGALVASAPALRVQAVEAVGDTDLGGGGVRVEGAAFRSGRVVFRDGAHLAHVTAVGATIRMEDGGHVDDLDIRETIGPGLELVRGTFDLHDVEVADVQEHVAGLPLATATGIRVIERASADFVDLRVFRTGARGLAVRGASATVTDGLLAGSGTLAAAEDGAALELVDVDMSDASVLVFVAASTLRAERVMGERADLSAVHADLGATVTLTGSTFLDAPNGFVSLLGEGTVAEVRNNVFQNAELDFCIAVSGATGRVVIEDNTLRDCTAAAISVLDSPDVLVAANEVVGVAESPFVPLVGEGITASGSTLEIIGNDVSGTARAGISLLRSAGTVRGNVIESPGDVGIRLTDPGPAPAVIETNTITSAGGAGVATFSADAAVRGNTISDTRMSTETGFGDGVVFVLGGEVEVSGNHISGSAVHGVRFADGVSGTIASNVITTSGADAIHEDCFGASTSVVVGENELSDNAGGVETCP